MLKLFLLACFSVNVLVGSVPLVKTKIEGRIIGGDDTDISKFPHHVAIHWLFPGFVEYSGGGFIVSPTHVLTTASNVDDSLINEDVRLTIRAGSSSFDRGGVVKNITKIHLHPKYDATTHDYNVAIIELATPLKFDNKTIKPIKLAAKEPSVNTTASTCGWGWIDFADEPDTLQSVTIPIVNRTKCASIHKEVDVIITPRMLCAGGDEENVYFGDSGGALVVKGEAVGIADYLFELGTGEHTSGVLPGAFVNIADPEINKFIKSIVKL